MSVEEALDQIFDELVNRRIQLSRTVDPNTEALLDNAPIGCTTLQTTTIPRVIWRKERVGANGWDVEIIPPYRSGLDVYVDVANASPNKNGSRSNPYDTIQAALDELGSATSLSDYNDIYAVHIAPGTYNESPTIPPARQLYFVFEGLCTVQGTVTITVDGSQHPGAGGAYFIGFLTSSGTEATSLGYTLRTMINGSIVFNNVVASPDALTVALNQLYVEELIEIPLAIDPTIPSLFASRLIVDGKDIGGGIWKAVYAPGSDVLFFNCATYAETDVRTYQCMEGCRFYDGLQFHSSSTRFLVPAPSGFINCDIDGTVTTTGKNLYLDEYTKKYLEASVTAGSATANLAHVGSLDTTRTPQVNVNAGATVTVDQFPTTVGNYVKWDVFVSRSTTQYRRSIMGAVWTAAGSINSQGEVKLGDVGTTTNLTLAVDISGGNVRLRASAVTTSSWKVQVVRSIDYTGWWY